MSVELPSLPAEEVKRLASRAEFDLVGFAAPEPIDAAVLGDWLAAGYHADMDWMQVRLAERLDVRLRFPAVKTVVALACNYFHGDSPSVVARYARGRDYHHTLRDRIRHFRRLLRERFGAVEDYASVDSGLMMEKVWAVRAGLGVVGKNGCLITEKFGSWVSLATFAIDRTVDTFSAARLDDVCGKCSLCIQSCPTGAIVADKVVDARACLSFQTIENEQAVPVALRAGLTGFLFGCDICQDVCPHNATAVIGSTRFAPRAVSARSAAEFAAMTAAQFDEWTPGTPLKRAGFDGLRRNAAYALGAMKDASAKALLVRLCNDASPIVAEAAHWALSQLPS
jgi:epoxyqueuosine reductase